MAIKFYNIRSKEIRVAETEPMIAAMYNSSDRGPNVQQGQDFGWRLAPEVVVQMRRIKGDITTIERIATKYKVSSDEVDEKLILKWISDMTSVEAAPVAQDEDFEEEYLSEIRRLEAKERARLAAAEAAAEVAETTTTTTTVAPAPTTTTTTTEVVEDMAKKVIESKQK